MRVFPVAGPQQIVPRRRTSSTELNWISRPDDNAHHKPGGHEYAVIGRDLGDRDWAAIDPLPLRKSKGLRFRFTPSLYFWQPTGTHVWCESQEERWEVLWLEFSGQVERLWAQPNNKDRAVRMHIDTEDESGDVTVALTDVTVTGSTKAAWEQTGDRTFHGQGGERRSTFTWTATDAAGNTATDTAVVVVGVKGLLGLF